MKHARTIIALLFASCSVGLRAYSSDVFRLGSLFFLVHTVITTVQRETKSRGHWISCGLETRTSLNTSLLLTLK